MSIILCADDFAQNSQISQGILQLAYQNRLSAISCMTQMPLWPKLAPELITLKKNNKNIKAGLHFNLTHAPINPLHSKIEYWLLSSYLRLINKKFITDCLNRQCDAFEDHMGCIPDFIDGHQHVHALPVIRDLLIETLQKRYASNITTNKFPYIRNITPFSIPNQQYLLKTEVIKKITQGFTNLLINNKIPHNAYFAGFYNLKPQNQFKNLLEQWLTHAPDNTLIMCHPGLQSNDITDPIRDTRFQEFQVLASDWFEELFPSPQYLSGVGVSAHKIPLTY